MINAKEELLKILKEINGVNETYFNIKCATIVHIDDYSWFSSSTNVTGSKHVDLKEGYNHEEYESFLNELDFEYDEGFGSQELFGTVWIYENNAWFSRSEYDGSEWWKYNEYPLIPEHLKIK